MKKSVLIAALTLAGSLAATTAAQTGPFKLDEGSPVKRIVTVGEDGGMFYVVHCHSGKRGSIEQYFEPAEVCVGPPRECKPAWDLVRAAESMCRK